MDKVSFLPDDYQKKRLQRRTNLISVGLFTVAMVAIVTAFAVTDRQRAQVRGELDDVNGQFEEAARRIELLDELRQRKRQIIRKANVTAVLVERVPRSLILAELINHMPAELSLLDLKLETAASKARRPARTALKQAKKKAKKKKDEDDDQATSSGPALPKIQPTETTFTLIGVAETDVQVAQYMRALGASPMFTDLNLVFSQEVPMDELTMRKFRVDMKLNPNVNPFEIAPLQDRRQRPSTSVKRPAGGWLGRLSAVGSALVPGGARSDGD